MEIRELKEEEIGNFFELVKFLDYETVNRAYEPGERKDNLDKFSLEIKEKLKKGDIIIIAKEKEELVGYIEGERGKFKRNKHVIHFNIAVKLSYSGKGLGGRLISKLEEESFFRGIERIELTVFCDNINALKLYKKMGYTIEGTKINSFKIDGKPKNEFLMAKSLKRY